MKRICVWSLFIVLAGTTAQAQGNESKSIDVSLYGGFALTQVEGTTDYADIWSYYWLTNVSERTVISGRSKSAPLFGAGIGYPLSPRVGVQLSFGYMKSDVPTSSDFDYAWTWAAAAGGGTYSRNSSWPGTGSLTVIPISFNAVGKFQFSRFEGFVSGGPSLFMNSFQARSSLGYGVSVKEQDEQFVDALQVDVTIPKTSWTGLGANVGAGLVYKLSPRLGVFAEGRGYLCPQKDLAWQLGLGKYDGIYFDALERIDFERLDADDVNANSSAMKFQVKPTFFQFAAGIKIFL